ncbi:hypothetical protein CL634_09980 [bacterium]|nr:hypothetical protein [bacterium]
MAGTYDPTFPMLRQMLALSIVNRLEDAEFEEVKLSPKPPKYRRRGSARQERVYERNVDKAGRLKVKVYTTVVGGTDEIPLEVRHSGKDAIRVCGTYRMRSGGERGIISERRVNRTGNIDDIVERMLGRMRETWKAMQTGERCGQCGAPKFVSKAGNKVCAEICWQTDEQKRASEIAHRSKARRNRRKGYYRG